MHLRRLFPPKSFLLFGTLIGLGFVGFGPIKVTPPSLGRGICVHVGLAAHAFELCHNESLAIETYTTFVLEGGRTKVIALPWFVGGVHGPFNFCHVSPAS